MERHKQLADAYELVARCDHYMVGITDEQVTADECDAAESVLIERQNAAKNGSRAWKRLNLALDLLNFHRDSLIRNN